jgi:hypothetical protein
MSVASKACQQLEVILACLHFLLLIRNFFAQLQKCLHTSTPTHKSGIVSVVK